MVHFQEGGLLRKMAKNGVNLTFIDLYHFLVLLPKIIPTKQITNQLNNSYN